MTKEEAKHFSEILKAYSEGKKIEVKDGNGKWGNTCEEPWFTDEPMNYRIKPEPKYRPYKNAEEFLKEQKEHGPYIKRLSLMGNYIYDIPRRVHCNKVEWEPFQGKEVRSLWDELLGYTWQDGHPCGIFEE